MKLSDLPTKLQVLLQLRPVHPPSTLFDFRLQSGAQTTNMLRPPGNPVLMDIDASQKTQPLLVRATAGRLSRDLAGDPKHIYKHKYDRKVHLAGDPKRKG